MKMFRETSTIRETSRKILDIYVSAALYGNGDMSILLASMRHTQLNGKIIEKIDFSTRKSDFLTGKSVFLARKSNFLTRKQLFHVHNLR
jgi:hypothetical protein